MSRLRSENKEEGLDEKMTRKEVKDFKANKSLIQSMRVEIDR